MELYTARWDARAGWRDALPAVDGDDVLVFTFGPSRLDDDDPLQDVMEAYRHSHVIGCSTSGAVQDDALSDGDVTVLIARFASTRVLSATDTLHGAEDSYEAGRRLGESLTKQEPDLRAAFVLSPGLDVNGSAVAAGLMSGTGPFATVTGGLAGDDDRFEHTWVMSGSRRGPTTIAAIGLAGPDLRIGHGSRGGWEPFGPIRRVTRSEGNVLHELDGQPALALYRHYLGERAEGLPATALLFPLVIRSDDEREVVRTVLSIDPDANTMTFAGDIPQGSTAQLMTGSLDKLVDGAAEAADDAVIEGAGAHLALAVSCIGRRLVLGRRTEDELEAVLERLPAGSRMTGFYSYGELNHTTDGVCDLLNQTMTITTYSEAG